MDLGLGHLVVRFTLTPPRPRVSLAKSIQLFALALNAGAFIARRSALQVPSLSNGYDLGRSIVL